MNIKKEKFKELTKREIEIIEYISKGFSNQKISELLFVEASTIRKHLYNIYNKLEIKGNNNTKRVILALEAQKISF